MPFNPNTGVWETGGDHAWTMPTTSAGDIVGGFNSAQAFQQNQEEQRLRMLLQQLTAQQTQYKMGREQEQDTREDQFRADLQPTMTAGSGMEIAPKINSEADLDTAAMGLFPEKAYEVMNRRTNNQDRLDSQEAGRLFKELNSNVTVGAMDPNEAANAMRMKFPRYENLALALQGTKIKPRESAATDFLGARTQNVDADTALKDQKYALLQQLNPKTVEGTQTKNEILKARLSIEQMKVKGGGATPADKQRAASNVFRAMQFFMRLNDIKTGAMQEDPQVTQMIRDSILDLANDAKAVLADSPEVPTSAGSGMPAPKKAATGKKKNPTYNPATGELE